MEIGTASIISTTTDIGINIDTSDMDKALLNTYHQFVYDVVHGNYDLPIQTMRVTFM